MPGRLRAKRKPVDTITPTPAAPQLEMVKLRIPEGAGKQAQVLGHGAEAAPAVVEVLAEVGVL